MTEGKGKRPSQFHQQEIQRNPISSESAVTLKLDEQNAFPLTW